MIAGGWGDCGGLPFTMRWPWFFLCGALVTLLELLLCPYIWAEVYPLDTHVLPKAIASGFGRASVCVEMSGEEERRNREVLTTLTHTMYQLNSNFWVVSESTYICSKRQLLSQ